MEAQVPQTQGMVDVRELGEQPAEERSRSPSRDGGARETGRVGRWVTSFRRK